VTAPVDASALRRDEFPWAERDGTIYLNHASTGPLPTRAQRELDQWTRLRTQPWRVTDEMQLGIAERARELAARCIGASSAEIAIVPNTSHGLNIASRCLPLAAGDIVVSPDREFPANVYPWMALEREGIRYQRVPCTPEGLPDEHALLAALEKPRVKVLALSWVSFATGHAVDLERLGHACRERGIYFVVDAIQGVGVRVLDVHASNIDVLACGAQKWLLSPWGTGFAYVRRELVRQLEPRQVGWMAVRDSSDFTRLLEYDLTWHDDARRFETGTLAYGDLAAFCASASLLHEIGIPCIAQHVHSLLDRMTDRLTSAGWEIVTPRDPHHRAGILTVRLPDPDQTSQRLEREGILCAPREGGLRISPFFYTTADEVDRAMDVLLGAT
jgi:cysteine desulfurase / selenocysteine lyase